MNRTNYRRTVFVTAMVAALWLLPLGAAAQIEEARVRIDGMV